MPTLQQFDAAIQRATQAGDAEAADHLMQQRQARQAEEAALDPAKDMSFGQRAMANVGAGIDSAWQGTKQLFGQGEGDEALAEKRRIDSKLADSTTGGSLMQIAGEVAPSIPLGLGLGAGMKGAAMLPRALKGITARSAAEGAVAGSLMPTLGDESRVTNMALAGAGGAVAPHLLPAAMKAARGARNLGDRVLATAGPDDWQTAAARRMGTRNTDDLLQRELPGGMPTSPQRFGPSVSRQSAAVETQDAALAGLERGSRTGGGQHWMPFDEAAQEARWQHLDQGLQTPTDLTQHLADANTIGGRVGAEYGKINQRPFNHLVDQFQQTLEQAKNSAKYLGDPTVKSAVDYLERTMQDAVVTPELVHTMRRTLSKGLTGAPGAGEAGVRAAASEPYIISLATQLDDMLDAGTKGSWNRWKGDYAGAMRKAEGAKADTNIRGKFIDQGTGVTRKPLTGVGGDPLVTGAALKQAMAAAGTMKRGPGKGQNILRPQSQQAMQDVIDDLDAQAIIQRSKAASTGGSGSDTMSNAAQAAALELLLPTGAGVARFVWGESNRKAHQEMQRQLAMLLQDPQMLRQFMARQAQLRQLRGAPTDQRLLGSAVGGGAVAASQQ